MKHSRVQSLKYGIFFAITALFLGCGADKDKALDKAYKAQQPQGSVLDIVANDPQLTTLAQAIESSGLSETLSNEQALYTLFAPSNEAFAALGEAVIASLLEDTDSLKHILLYHVLPNTEVNAYKALQLAGKTTESANGIRLSVNRWEQQIFINGIAVSILDRKANNGVVHVIDKVLLPPDIKHRTVTDVKADILDLAISYKGLTDTDFTLQSTFEPLLAELITLAPQTPISERINLVSQSWTQIWGPYSYGSGQDGVDPNVSVDEIYQVVFKDGYYYNVTPLIDETSGAEQIGLLRGEFIFDEDDDQCLQVKFVRFPGLESRPAGIALWDLPALEETGTVTAETGVASIEIVPSWIVRSFFGGGQLCEVYTDETMRISISKEDDNPDYRKLYIMERVIF